MLASVAYPLAQSFERRVSIYRKWKFMIPAMLITAGFFLIWDEFFTRIGVWSFNETYTLGIFIGSLPLEEWLFFLIVPYACFFVYFVAEYFIKKDVFRTSYKYVSSIMIAVLLVFAGIYYDRWYSATACILPAILLIWLTFVKQVQYLGRFFTGYFISLIPFLIVNGILTCKPVVVYNNSENSGIRIFINGVANIPIEDLAYCLLLLLMNISLYERFREKSNLLK